MSKRKHCSVMNHGLCQQPCTFTTFDAIVRSYLTEYRQRTEDMLANFKSLPSLSDAIVKAAWDDKGGHQRRVKLRPLTEFTRNLQTQKSTFEEKPLTFELLYDKVKAQKVWGIGDLTLYDTALGLGGFLRCLPSRVFLHRGTRKGAEALAALGRVNPRAESISMTDLPPAFRKLQAYEVEDCLCLYKPSIRRIVSRMVSKVRT